MLKDMENTYGTDGVAFVFSFLMFPELMNKSKEEMTDYAKIIKDSGKITEEQYQNALEFVNKIDELKQMLKKELDK